MSGLRNANRCTPCLEGAHDRCTGSAGNVGCGCVHAAPVPRHVIPDEPGDRDTAAARSILRRFGLHANASTTTALADAFARVREEGRDAAVRPFRELFAGGPDTSCRTVYRTGTVEYGRECVEVPLDDLRAAFVEAGDPE